MGGMRLTLFGIADSFSNDICSSNNSIGNCQLGVNRVKDSRPYEGNYNRKFLHNSFLQVFVLPLGSELWCSQMTTCIRDISIIPHNKEKFKLW